MGNQIQISIYITVVVFDFHEIFFKEEWHKFDIISHYLLVCAFNLQVVGLSCEYGCIPGAICNGNLTCECTDGFEENGTCHTGSKCLNHII